MSLREIFVEKSTQDAVEAVKRVLGNNKHPQLALDIPHSYQDKFFLAEYLTRSAIASILNSLSNFGLKSESYQQILRCNSGGSTTTFRFSARESCKLVRTEKKNVDSDKQVSTNISFGGVLSTVTNKVITSVTEYVWELQIYFDLFTFPGTDSASSDRVSFRNFEWKTELRTTTSANPRYESRQHEPIDIDLSWLFRQISQEGEKMQISFGINRVIKSCRTPRRNNDVGHAEKFFLALQRWSERTSSFILDLLRGIPPLSNAVDATSLNNIANSTFLPCLPLFEKKEENEGFVSNAVMETDALPVSLVSAPSTSPVLSPSDVNALLEEQLRSLTKACEQGNELLASTSVAGDSSVAHMIEMYLVGRHAGLISQQFLSSIDYVEQMLTDQLIAATGRVLKTCFVSF